MKYIKFSCDKAFAIFTIPFVQVDKSMRKYKNLFKCHQFSLDKCI